jgi:hypothetical protein
VAGARSPVQDDFYKYTAGGSTYQNAHSVRRTILFPSLFLTSIAVLIQQNHAMLPVILSIGYPLVAINDFEWIVWGRKHTYCVRHWQVHTNIELNGSTN